MYTKNNKIKTYTRVLLFLCSLLILSSCSKKEVEKQVSPDQVAQLAFSINGIEEASEGTPSKYQASLPETNTDSESQLLQLGNISAEVSVTSGPIKAQTAPSNSKQRAANMTDGYKYRVVVVNATTGTVVGSVQATASATGAQAESAKIDVVKGGSYKWYAYSYNEAADVPVLPNEANPVFTPSYDKDLLIASSGSNTVLVPGTPGQGSAVDVQVPITFKHALAKVTVSFDASSRSDQITVLNAALSSATYFNTGSITLNTTNGALSYSPTPVTLPSATLFSINNTPSGNVLTKSFYTIPASPTPAITSFGVAISNLTVGPLTTTNRTISFGNTIVPAVGKEMIAKINILDVTAVNGAYWATGNLYYENGVYKIRNEDTTPRSLYILDPWIKTDGWNWIVSIPYTGSILRDSSQYDSNKPKMDPCKRVLPINTWRMPTKTDFENLVDLVGSPGKYERQATNFVSGKIGYDRFRDNINVDKWVQFNKDGDQINGRGGTLGNYWSSTQSGSNLDPRPYILYIVHNANPTVPTKGTSGIYYNIRCVLNRQ
ncbi:hypothetical protein ACR782_12890 [Sphingobacterium spiritivorum]|uniref:hypothetical protein n=1 Tax=Sphingobacterium spiritivorum TaxID=258 RepID=UPI003DA3BFF7